MSAARRRLAAVLDGGERGFTLIEVLVAAIILALGSMAVMMTLVAGIHNTQRSKETQVVSDVAQREMEKVRSLPFAEVAMASPAPVGSSETANPDHRISGTSFYLSRNLTEAQALCIAGEGECASPAVGQEGRVLAGPSDSCVGGTAGNSFEVGGVKGQVYCFVTVRQDPSCEVGSELPSCAIKRVTIAVWLQQSAGSSRRPVYYELQSDVVDSEPETAAG